MSTIYDCLKQINYTGRSYATVSSMLKKEFGAKIDGRPVTPLRVKQALEKIKNGSSSVSEKDSGVRERSSNTRRTKAKKDDSSQSDVRNERRKTKQTSGQSASTGGDRPERARRTSSGTTKTSRAVSSSKSSNRKSGEARKNSSRLSAKGNSNRTVSSKSGARENSSNDMQAEIRFNGKIKEWAWLSNFHSCCIELAIDGQLILFANAEAAFQYMKTDNKLHKEKILNSHDASKARYWGSAKADCPMREDWEDIREEVMFNIIKAKFTQNLPMTIRLLETGTRPLVEYAPWDKEGFWGVNNEGGENVLGQIIMEVRDFLKKSKFSFSAYSVDMEL